MTRPRDIIKRIGREAKRNGLSLALVREGGKPTIYDLDGITIPVPRHREINELTTEGIYRDCEPKLGKGWWRR